MLLSIVGEYMVKRLILLVLSQILFLIFLFFINESIYTLEIISSYKYHFLFIMVSIQFIIIELLLLKLTPWKDIAKYAMSFTLVIALAFIPEVIIDINDFRLINITFIIFFLTRIVLSLIDCSKGKNKLINISMIFSFSLLLYFNFITIKNYYLNGLHLLLKNESIEKTSNIKDLNAETLKRLFIVGINGKNDFDLFLNENKFGGIFFNKINEQHKKDDFIPMILSFDYSGPTKDFLYKKFRIGIPSQLALGSSNNYDLIYKSADTLSSEINKKLGLNTLFGPVVDLKTSYMDSVIKSRSFGNDPSYVSKCSIVYSFAFQKNNIQTVLKHFPGHPLKTNKDTNPHYTKEVEVYLKKETMIHKNLLPFKNLVENPYSNVNFLMTDHIIIKDISPDTPITILKNGITRLNTDYNVNFKGKFIIDDIMMLLKQEEKHALQYYKNQTKKDKYETGMKNLISYTIDSFESGHHFILATLSNKNTVNDFFFRLEKEVNLKDEEFKKKLLSLINDNIKFLNNVYGKKAKIKNTLLQSISKKIESYFMEFKVDSKKLSSFMVFNKIKSSNLLERYFYNSLKQESTLIISTFNKYDDFYSILNKNFNISNNKNIIYHPISKKVRNYKTKLNRETKTILDNNKTYSNIIFSLTDSRDLLILEKIYKKYKDTANIHIFILSNPDSLYFGREGINKSINLEKILTTSSVIVLFENSLYSVDKFFSTVLEGNDKLENLKSENLSIDIPNIHYYSNIENKVKNRLINLLVSHNERKYYSAYEYFIYKDYILVTIFFTILLTAFNIFVYFAYKIRNYSWSTSHNDLSPS